MKYKLAQHVSFTAIDDEAVILDLNSGAYFGLNHIGALLMIELNNGASSESAITKIAEQYQIAEKTVEEDIQQLLSQMIDQSLIEAI